MSWEQIQPYLQNQQNGAVPMGHMSIYDGPKGAWTVRNGAVTFDDGSGQSVPVGFLGQFPGNTGYTNGQWNPNFMTGFPMNNMLPVNKFQRGMPPPIPGTLPVLQPTVGPTTTTPTVGTLPPDPDDPNNMRGGEADEFQAQLRDNAQRFYFNNPNHWMTKIDSKLRRMMGLPSIAEEVRAKTRARQKATEVEGRDAGHRGQGGSGMGGPGGGPGWDA